MHGPLGYYRLGRTYPRTFIREEYRRKQQPALVAIPAANEVQAIANLVCNSTCSATASMSVRQPSTTFLLNSSTQTATAAVLREATSARTCVSSITANWAIQLAGAANLQSQTTLGAAGTTDANTFFVVLTCSATLAASGKVEALSCGTGYLCRPIDRPPKCYKLVEIRGEVTKYYQTASKAFLPGITRCIQKDLLGANTHLPVQKK